MAKVAILGFGTVGSGVLEVLRRSARSISTRLGEEIVVKYICDIRDFSLHPDAQLFVNNIDVVLSDPEVKVVIETIGGLKPAYFYVKSALESGRSVVTSNKELVATHGAELLALAKRNNCCFLFEASVGGGTPIITPMHQCLSANVISSVMGIVNGTTNFMLTCMAKDKLNFADALKLAQGLGYAETIDPSADVDGIDAGRKIAILSSLAFGKHIFPQNVPMRGIRDITLLDMKCAAKMQCSIKLIAWAHKSDDMPFACGVEPMLVPNSNQLSGVQDVFNAVMLTGDMLGDVVFYGKGAGKLPTASAVCADVVDALKNGVAIHDSLFWHESTPIEGKYQNTEKSKYYIRAIGNKPDIETVFDKIEIIKNDEEIIFVTKEILPSEFADSIEKLESKKIKINNFLRIVSEE